MKLLNLPISTEINRVVPKNSFDKYTNTRQKKLFTDSVEKIRWLNKLSTNTINLTGNDIQEIQVFEVTLKKKTDITEVLHVIDRAVPYHIVFIVLYNDQFLFSASEKHAHPTNDDNAVIDWTFQSKWIKLSQNQFQLNLKQKLDFVFTDFCKQLAGRVDSKLTLADLVKYEQQVYELKNNIQRIKASIKRSKQFNRKVELNLGLQKLIKELDDLEVKVR